jgi:hypothetical protein
MARTNPAVESAVQRFRTLNERIVEAAKDGGEESIKTYERVLENLAEGMEAAGERGGEWIQEVARGQAELTRKLAEAFPALLERLGMRTREVKETAADTARKVPAVRRVEGEARGALSREEDLPIPHYDSLTVREINEQLPNLSQIELGKIDAYEARNKNRKTVRDKIKTLRS